MPETTSKLFHKLRGRESGKAVLEQEQTEPTCAQVLQNLLEQAGVSAPEWIAAADISKSYAYQILRGERIPGRDILLRTALVLRLSLKEAQRLLAVGDCGGALPQNTPGRGSDFCPKPSHDPSGNREPACLPVREKPLCQGELIWRHGNSFCGSIRRRCWTSWCCLLA